MFGTDQPLRNALQTIIRQDNLWPIRRYPAKLGKTIYKRGHIFVSVLSIFIALRKVVVVFDNFPQVD